MQRTVWRRLRVYTDAPLRLDPNYALAYALLARTLWIIVSLHAAKPSADELVEYADLARTAVRLGQADPETLCIAAYIIALPGGELEEGIAIIDRALALNPNSADALAMSGMLRAYSGDTEMAFRAPERGRSSESSMARASSPRHSDFIWPVLWMAITRECSTGPRSLAQTSDQRHDLAVSDGGSRASRASG